MSKIISKGSVIGFQRWELPMVEDVSGAVANAKEDRVSGLLTAEKIERIQSQAFKEAYDEGLAKGRKDGMAAGQAEINHKIQLLNNLLCALGKPFQQLDDDVEKELIGLSLAVARQLVRRELKADPGQVVGVVHEALAILPIGSRDIRVCLHPEDLKLVHETLSISEADRVWTLVGDLSLQRGDCRIVTETSQIDATLETRLAAVVSQLFGGDREYDQPILSAYDNESQGYSPDEED